MDHERRAAALDALGRAAAQEAQGRRSQVFLPGCAGGFADLEGSFAEVLLCSIVEMDWGSRDLGSRDNLVRLVESIAFEAVPDGGVRARLIKNTMTYFDRLRKAATLHGLH